MKKTGSITLNDKIITVNELTVRQILTIKEDFNSASILDSLRHLLPLVTDASEEFLLELAPSEINELYGKVREVNAGFFALLPLDKLLAGYRDLIVNNITNNLSGLSAGSSPQATAPESGTTAGISSSSPIVKLPRHRASR